MKIRLWYTILLFHVLELLAYEQAVTVKGIINCRGQRMPGLFVQLWDEDFFFDADDLMGSTNADYRGVFCVRGFADEFTEIDPFVLIEHNCGFEGLNQKAVYHHYIPSEFIVEGNRSHKIYHLGDIELFTPDAPIREHPRGKFVSTGKEDLDKRLKECIPIYVQYVKMTKSTEGVSQHEISYLLPTDATEATSVPASVQQPNPQSQASLVNIMNTKITVEEKQKNENEQEHLKRGQEELKAREDEDRRKEEELRHREKQLRMEEERTRNEQERLRVEIMSVEEERIEQELDELQKEEKETERRILQEKAEEQRRIEEEAIREQRRLEFEARKEEERKAQEEYEKKKAEYQKRLEEYWRREEERQKEVARREEERRRLAEQKVREHKTQTHLLLEDNDEGGFDQSSELKIQTVTTLDPCVAYYERQQKQALNYLDQRLQGQAFFDPCVKRH